MIEEPNTSSPALDEPGQKQIPSVGDNSNGVSLLSLRDFAKFLRTLQTIGAT